MASDFTTIPVIDVSPLSLNCNDLKVAKDKDVLEVVRMLHQACREAGFFYVKGHGIPDSLMKNVRDVTRKFFNLACEEKEKIKLSESTGFRGYQRIGQNITKGNPDKHEAIDCYREITGRMYGQLGKTLVGFNQWPEYPLNMKPLMEEYILLLKELSRKIMRGIALALGGSADMLEVRGADDPFWVLRIIGYPGSINMGMPQENADELGCGAHTDYGLLTLVNQDDDIHALQVKNRAGEWISAIPIPGTFLCNIGDMLKIWSNGEYESTLHRVINSSSRYRVSVAFFYEPNFDAPIEPLEICKRRAGGVAKFGKVVYGEHLVKKVLTNFVE